MTAPAAGAARYTGTRIRRVEDPRLVQGRGTFVDDIVRPRMLHACFVRSPVAHAALGVIDVSAALALRGVRAVLTAADVNPQVHEQWYTSIGKHVPDTPRPPLADGRVRFVGDPVALVVAESRYIAEDAVDLVAVDYDQLPPVVDYVTARGADVPGPAPRHRRAPGARDHAGHRRWLRAKGHADARGDVPGTRGHEAARSAEVDRGPAREPDRCWNVTP